MSLPLSVLRHVLQRPDVRGDVLALRAVAARRRIDELAVLVAQRHRQPVDLRLGGEDQRLLGIELEEAADALDEARHVLFRERIVEREHRHRVPHLGEAPGRRRADLQRQAFQRAQLRKALLDRAIALAQRVVFGVRDRRRVVLVVALVVRGRAPRAAVRARPWPASGRVKLVRLRASVTSALPCRHSGRGHPAALISRSAALRASSVISAPASMRAISSRRRSAATSVMLVATRLPRAQRILGDHIVPVGARRDLRRMGHGDHLHLVGEPREPLPDRVRDRAADPGVDLVEHQRRRRAAIRQHDLEREQEARELAAGGDLHQRPRPRARIGLDPEFDAVDAVGPAASGSILVKKRARSSFSGLSSAVTALSSFAAALRRAAESAAAALGRPPPPRARMLRAASILPRRHRSPRGRPRSARARPRDRRPRHCICAPPRAARTAAPRSGRARAGRGWRRRNAASRCARASSSAVSAASSAFTGGSISAGACARRRSSRRSAADSAGDRRALARDRLVRVAQVLGHLVDLHHGGALLGERGLLAGLRLQPARARRPRGADNRPRAAPARPARDAPRPPPRRRGARVHARCDRRGIVLQTRIGIEQAPVRRHVDQRALVVLAVDFHQRRAERLEHLHAHRLIVDEGAGAPVGELHAAQDQAVLGGDAVLGNQRERRMVRCRRRTPPSPAPARRRCAPGWHRRGCRARARRRRAGSTCRRRSRRSAPTVRPRSRCRAVRSERCRGSRGGRAWLQSIARQRGRARSATR